MEDFTGLWFDCASLKTSTSKEQCQCEKECASYLKPFNTTNYRLELLEKLEAGSLINTEREIRLLRSMHGIYLTNGLGMQSLIVIISLFYGPLKSSSQQQTSYLLASCHLTLVDLGFATG